MTEIASRGQLRASFLRRAAVTVPAVVLLGFASGWLSGSSEDNPWFAALAKPALMPPGWVFPVAWTILYVLMGLALALILHARGARGRGGAVMLFIVQLAFNLCWSPLFFTMHRVGPALLLILVILGLAILTTIAFGRIRALAAWLMVPYLVWLSFATGLNWRVDQLNPNAGTLVPSAATTQITL